jgi:GNAT superfamily N-acetyltransferase
MARVFVSTSVAGGVAGYYALCTGGVEHINAPERIKRGVARHAIPVMILTRLAVAQVHQGGGLGRALLRDALRRVASVSEEVGVRALLIHAKDQRAKDFYMSFGEFEDSPTDPLHLFLLMKDLRKLA